MIKPQMTEVGPPLGSARFRDADRAVQEFKMAKASPSIARGLKWRLSSALWPIDSYKKVYSAFILGSGKFGNGSARLKSGAFAIYSSAYRMEDKDVEQDVPSERHRQKRGSAAFPSP